MNHTTPLFLTTNNTEDDQTLMSVMELAEYLNVGKNHAYNLLRQGEIKGFRIGNIWKVSKEAVNKYIREKSGLE